MCPHTSKLLFVFCATPLTATAPAARYYYISVRILVHICVLFLSSAAYYYHISVKLLVYMCPHTTSHASEQRRLLLPHQKKGKQYFCYYHTKLVYVCPHTSIYTCPLFFCASNAAYYFHSSMQVVLSTFPHTTIHATSVCAYYYIGAAGTAASPGCLSLFKDTCNTCP